MPEGAEQLLVPPQSEWEEVLKDNLRLQIASSFNFGFKVAEFRQRVLDAARLFSSSLLRTGKERGLSGDVFEKHQHLVEQSCLKGCSPLVVTGHQPLIYHCGLMAKNQALNWLSHNKGALGLNIIMDTSEGDGGEIYYPQVSRERMAVAGLSIADDRTLFLGQRLVSQAQLAGAFNLVEENLEKVGCNDALQGTKKAAAFYLNLAALRVVTANSLVRLGFEGERFYLELPFSELCALEESQIFFARLLADGPRLWEVYNRTLCEERQAHRIKNPANPFPDLLRLGNRLEMPFWFIDLAQGKRLPLWLEKEKGAWLLWCAEKQVGDLYSGAARVVPKGLVVPRGGLIAFFLRLLCSDLFVHGLGGAHYDTFSDSFSLRYLGIRLPRFVIASANRYLFGKELQVYEQNLKVKNSLWHIYSHTAEYLGRGLFPEALEAGLFKLVLTRRQLVDELIQLAGSKEQKRAVLLQLNGLNKQVKLLVKQSALYQKAMAPSVSAETLQVWRFREFPFWFFP